MELVIAQTWDGQMLAPEDRATVWIAALPAGLEVRIASPFFGDLPPSAPPGHTDRLWEYEVVEVFLCGEDGRYLELELGPHGHYWIGVFSAPRQREQYGMEIEYRAEPPRDGQWRGRAVVPAALVPPPILQGGPASWNACAVHGTPLRAAGPADVPSAGRRYHATFPVPGSAPDFHRPECFGPLHLAPAPR